MKKTLKMKKLLGLVAIATVAATTFPAVADELPEFVTQSGVSLPGATPDWTGGYVGGSLANVASQALYCDSFDGDEYDCDDPDDGLPKPSPEGGMIGVTGGYDWQNGDIIYGIAGDVMFGDLSDVVGDSADPSYGCSGGCGLDVSSIAMLRGRIGYATGDFLPYLTAGVAVTQAAAFEPGGDTVDGTFTNAVVGVGAEYIVSETLSAGFDILQLIEGNEQILNDDFCTDCGATSFSTTIARFTLAYRF
jgi:outer membrane immunogenic protein